MNQKLIWLPLLLALTVLACNLALPQSAPTSVPTIAATRPNLPQSEDDVPRITVEQARSAMERGEAVIMDVRSTEAFIESHILGAISIPLNQIEDNPNRVTLEKSTWIITYCT